MPERSLCGLVDWLDPDVESEGSARRRAENEARRRAIAIDFVERRARASAEHGSRVRFDEVVRLVAEWWDVRPSQSALLRDAPSILMVLLCAKAFDLHGVDGTYLDTLSRWFGQMAHIARKRRRVDFDDDDEDPERFHHDGAWVVLDPASPENNVVPAGWGEAHLDELAGWFEDAHDSVNRALEADAIGYEAAARSELGWLFGDAIEETWAAMEQGGSTHEDG